jgi:hypothetical protein
MDLLESTVVVAAAALMITLSEKISTVNPHAERVQKKYRHNLHNSDELQCAIGRQFFDNAVYRLAKNLQVNFSAESARGE